METIQTEVLVIGSGFGAAAPALRMAKAGFEVLMVEKGSNIEPSKDFRQTSDPSYLLKYLKSSSGDRVSFTYAEALGGGSGFYEMVSLRAPSKAFEQVDKQGHRLWPTGIDRTVFGPHYDEAERMLHVEQIQPEEIPKSGIVFSKLMKNLGYSCDRARYAVKGCVGSGYCVSGCIFGAKQSLHMNYLPEAKKSGMKILTDMEAKWVGQVGQHRTYGRSIDGMPYRYEVQCNNTREKQAVRIEAKVLILGGGTVGTARLLMSSGAHLPRISRHVGKNIAFNGSVKVAGLLPEDFIEGDMLSGRSHPGMISYHFLDRYGITISCAKPLPLFLVHAARLTVEGETRMPSYWGKAHVELMKQYRRKMIVLYALGLTPPTAEIRKTGATIFPVLPVDGELVGYYNRTKALLHHILRQNNCKDICAEPIDHDGSPLEEPRFESSHMVGSCRMANRKEDGVVDAYGEVFDYPDMYVTDGASIPSSLAVNSSLTILANAERIASNLLKKYKK